MLILKSVLLLVQISITIFYLLFSIRKNKFQSLYELQNGEVCYNCFENMDDIISVDTLRAAKPTLCKKCYRESRLISLMSLKNKYLSKFKLWLISDNFKYIHTLLIIVLLSVICLIFTKDRRVLDICGIINSITLSIYWVLHICQSWYCKKNPSKRWV